MTTTTAAEAATTSAPQEHGGGRSERAAAALSERLYARHHRMVLGLCRGLLRDPVEAEDAAQQTFLSAHRSLLNGADPREPAAWLATIARNECWARTSARMREPLPTDDLAGAMSSSDPVQEAIRRADLNALWLAIKQLPRQQRDALLLREFGGLRYDELAVALAVSEPSVESLLFRARARLRVQLKAAYAAVTGGAWLEPLARLLAGGGGPALATKAVALTLGAAAVTGGAVVAPSMLEHHAPSRHTPVVHHLAVHTQPPAPDAAPIAPAVAPVEARASSIAPRAHESGREHSQQSSEGGDDRTTVRAETSRSHDGGDDHATSTTTTVTFEHETEQRSRDSVSGSGSDSGSSGDSGSSSDGSGESGSGETPTITTTTQPILTVPTTTLPISDGGHVSGGNGDG